MEFGSEEDETVPTPAVSVVFGGKLLFHIHAHSYSIRYVFNA